MTTDKKVALITGANRGIGRALVHDLIARGACTRQRGALRAWKRSWCAIRIT